MKVAKWIHQMPTFIHHAFAPWLCCKTELAEYSWCYCWMDSSLLSQYVHGLLAGLHRPAPNQLSSCHRGCCKVNELFVIVFVDYFFESDLDVSFLYLPGVQQSSLKP